MQDSHTLFDGHGWRIALESAPLPDGRVKTAARAYRCDSVHIIARTDKGGILLLREYRPFFATDVWMLPTGKMDKETDPLIAAQRELQEETGFRAEEIVPFRRCFTAEGIVMTHHIYLAKKLIHDPLPQDATEQISVVELSLDDAIDRVMNGMPLHTISAMGLLAYGREMKKAG